MLARPSSSSGRSSLEHDDHFEVRRDGRNWRTGLGAEGAADLFLGAGEFGVFGGERAAEVIDGEVGVDAGEKFVGIEGLGDIINGAEFKAAHDVLGVGFSGEKDDGDFAPLGIGSDLAAGFETVHFRHHDIEEDEVGLEAGEKFEGLPAVGGDTEAVAFLFEDD